MDIKQLLLTASVLAASVPGLAAADDMQRLYVQEAEIEIDPAQLENYKAAVTEQIETATHVEPGVLVLYAVSEKDNPARVRVFKIYRDAEAYRSLQLVQTIPIALGSKAR